MRKLIERPGIAGNVKAGKIYGQLGQLVHALEQKDLPTEVVTLIDNEVENLNSTSDSNKNFAASVKKTENKIVQLVEKKLKIVPRNYYKKLWFLLGMSAFGLPLGAAIGLSVENIGLLGVGLPIGMGIGFVFGSSLDQKALKEGRQLDFEVKY
jgi:hypothetical protein